MGIPDPKSLMSEKVINPNVVFVNSTATIKSAIEIMMEKKISSVLVIDEETNVIGIVTERDIVRKLTLVDVPDKLERAVSTIMTRPVSFVSLESYKDDILAVYLAKGIRHFPILKGKDAKSNNIVGIISVTDFLKQFLLTGKSADGKQDAQVKEKFKMVVIGQSNTALDHSVAAIGKTGIEWELQKDFNSFFTKVDKSKLPVILFDADSFPTSTLKKEMAVVLKYPGPLLVMTKNLPLLAAFQNNTNREKQAFLLKPVDVSYAHWLVTQKWRQNSLA